MVSALVAPKVVDTIRQSLPERLRPDFDADVRRAEMSRLQGVLRLWRARGAARNDPERIRRLESAVRTDPASGAVTWTADPRA
ncbi:hypothetical protein [Yinghuangia soli]|uniref:Uncharacterized protein n=1 Tax=Yinghuangia soli TaxID=2908204 RepID=A0AA41Q482_9ACTN|nr:hypothetical protein [Yinghuangia soli]MCF2529812.1 hypothetical protein [Yinghuangia soli]